MKVSAIQLLLLCLYITLFATNFTTLSAQSPYDVNLKKEIPFLATAGGVMGMGYYLNTLPPVFTPDELLTLNADDINRFDRFATGRFSDKADELSDIIWLGSHFTPALFLVGENSRQNMGQIVVMYTEAIFINSGLTSMTKSLFRRPRPFVFNDQVLEENKLTKGARKSFLSGHTSMTAVNTFFVAKVFSDFYPDSKLKPFVWGVAILAPAATGLNRVLAGKHYPTDVLAGYALGATIGYLVPHWHRSKKFKERGVRIDVGMQSARLVWQFNTRPKEKIVFP